MDDPREPPTSPDEVRQRGFEYRRHLGAFQNALDLYRAHGMAAELNELADDAWVAGALEICREALAAAGNVRQLLIYANVLDGYSHSQAWIDAFRRTAAQLRSDK